MKGFGRVLLLFAILLTSLPVVSADSDTVSLPPMEVTGEMVSHTVQDTGNSVLVVDEETLEERPELRTVRDLLQEIPNVTVVTGTGKAPTVRGVDGTGPAENANAFFAGSRPRLNWQIDGRSATYNEVVFGDLGIWDMERIEVFRGPQSSLVGRNAIAGTVRVETHDPGKDRQSAIRVEGGNLDQRRLSLMHNEPINDNWAVRLAADGFQRESPVDYDSYSGVDDPADIEGHAVRGKLLYEPGDSRDTRLLFTLADTEYEGPNGEIVVRPFEKQRSNFPEQPVHNPKTTSFGVEYSALLSDSLVMEFNGSVSDFDFRRKTAPGGSNAEIDNEEQALEPRIRYFGSNGSEWVAGLWFHRSRQDESIEFLGTQRFEDQSDTRAVYTEGKLPLSDHFEITMGLRYEEEGRERDGGDPTRSVVDINIDETYDALLPKLGVSFIPNDRQIWGILYSRGYNAGGGGVTFGAPIVNYEYKEEYVDSLELFGRQKWLGNRLQTTQNLFYSQYEDMQLPFDLTPNDSRDEAFVIRNADEVRTVGLELGANWLVSDRTQLFGNLAFLDTEIADYPDSGLEGNSLLTAPSWSGQIGASWSVERWQLNLSSHFTDGWYTDINNRPDGKTDPHAIINTSAAYQVGKDMKAYLAIRNLLDEDEPIARYPGTNPSSGLPDRDFDTAVLVQPRTLTAGLQVNF